MRFYNIARPNVAISYKDEQKGIDKASGQVVRLQASEIIKFDAGVFETEDKEKINFVKNLPDYKLGRIVEESVILEKKAMATKIQMILSVCNRKSDKDLDKIIKFISAMDEKSEG